MRRKSTPASAVTGEVFLAIGQNQNKFDEGFVANSAFQGALSALNIWDFALEDSAVTQMAASLCDEFAVGNLLSWPEVLIFRRGELAVESLGCQAKSGI